MTVMLFLRNDVEASLIKLSGQLYEKKPNGVISNVFRYQLVNKTIENIDDVTFKLLSHDGKIEVVGISDLNIPKEDIVKGTLFVYIKNNLLTEDREKIKVGIYANDKLIETASTNFLGPRKFN